MRRFSKQTISTALAVGILGYAVMLTASLAKGPYQHGSENAFEGPPVGHPEKALIWHAWVPEPVVRQAAAVNHDEFDWGLQCAEACPKCGHKDPKVTPVVLDVPELMGPSEAAIDMIKRKTGINAFRGTVFEGPEAPAAKMLKQEEPAELKAFDRVLRNSGRNVLDHSGIPQAGYGYNFGDATISDALGGHAESAAGAATDRIVESPAASPAEIWNGRPACPMGTDCGQAALTAIDNGKDCPGSSVNIGVAITPVPSDPVELLRQHGSGMDEIANTLEEHELYHEADAIRDVAQRLRLKARALKHGSAEMVHIIAPQYQTAHGITQPAGVAYGYPPAEDRCSETCSDAKCTCPGTCTVSSCPAKKTATAEHPCDALHCPTATGPTATGHTATGHTANAPAASPPPPLRRDERVTKEEEIFQFFNGIHR